MKIYNLLMSSNIIFSIARSEIHYAWICIVEIQIYSPYISQRHLKIVFVCSIRIPVLQIQY
jgi:hypothetical protein